MYYSQTRYFPANFSYPIAWLYLV